MPRTVLAALALGWLSLVSSDSAVLISEPQDFDEVGSPRRFSEVQGFNFGLDFKYVLGEDNVEYGLEVVGLQTDFSTTNSLAVAVTQPKGVVLPSSTTRCRKDPSSSVSD